MLAFSVQFIIIDAITYSDPTAFMKSSINSYMFYSVCQMSPDPPSYVHRGYSTVRGIVPDLLRKDVSLS
jgi:hypothetical protein